jgi:hypothetical protein
MQWYSKNSLLMLVIVAVVVEQLCSSAFSALLKACSPNKEPKSSHIQTLRVWLLSLSSLDIAVL